MISIFTHGGRSHYNDPDNNDDNDDDFDDDE
jgi:hypothetical protein